MSNARTHTTLDDLATQEILPALGEYVRDHDIDGIVSDLRNAELIKWTGRGFRLVKDDDTGQPPRFWDIVEANHIDADDAWEGEL